MSTNTEAEQEIAIVAAGKTAPRVTPDRINNLMARVSYVSHVPEGTTSTFVHAFLDYNGPRKFLLATGHSACVSPENFDSKIGFDIAKKDAEAAARRSLWRLEGYALKCVLDSMDYLNDQDAGDEHDPS